MISISPNGSRIAISIGINFTGYTLMIFNTAELTQGGTLNLMADSSVWKSPQISCLASL